MLCASCSAEPCSWARGASADPTAQVFSSLCGCEDSSRVWAMEEPWPRLSRSDRGEAKATGSSHISQT